MQSIFFVLLVACIISLTGGQTVTVVVKSFCDKPLWKKSTYLPTGTEVMTTDNDAYALSQNLINNEDTSTIAVLTPGQGLHFYATLNSSQGFQPTSTRFVVDNAGNYFFHYIGVPTGYDFGGSISMSGASSTADESDSSNTTCEAVTFNPPKSCWDSIQSHNCACPAASTHGAHSGYRNSLQGANVGNIIYDSTEEAQICTTDSVTGYTVSITCNNFIQSTDSGSSVSIVTALFNFFENIL